MALDRCECHLSGLTMSCLITVVAGPDSNAEHRMAWLLCSPTCQVQIEQMHVLTRKYADCLCHGAAYLTFNVTLLHA